MTGRRSAIALILLVALICHGALLLESVRIADDWSYFAWLERGEWATIHAVQLYANLPLMEYYFRAYSYFPDPLVAARTGSFLIVLVSGILTYLLCVESGHVGNEDAAFIALISMVYPGYMMHTSFTLSVFTFCYMLFLAGVLMAFRSERASGIRHASMRVIALLLFMLSFTTNSLLVYFGAFLVAHFLVLRRAWSLPLPTSAVRYAMQRADYWVIPLLFWAIKSATKATYETNPEYNTIAFGAANLAGFGDFASAIWMQWQLIVKSYWFIAAFPVAWWLASLRKPADFAAPASSGNTGALLAFGFLLLVCGTLPYVVVGKTPSGDLVQWGTRVCLLLGLPAGIVAVGLVRMLRLHARLPRGAAIGLLAAIVTGCCVVHLRHYVYFIANEIEARSLEVNLARTPEAAGVSVFGFVTDMPSYNVTHQKYSWAYFLRSSLGGELNRIAFMEGNPDLTASSHKLYLPDQIREETNDWWSRLYGMNAPTDGKQATLRIERGPARRGVSDRKLVFRYLRAKWAGKEQLADFLRGVTSVEVISKD